MKWCSWIQNHRHTGKQPLYKADTHILCKGIQVHSPTCKGIDQNLPQNQGSKHQGNVCLYCSLLNKCFASQWPPQSIVCAARYQFLDFCMCKLNASNRHNRSDSHLHMDTDDSNQYKPSSSSSHRKKNHRRLGRLWNLDNSSYRTILRSMHHF